MLVQVNAKSLAVDVRGTGEPIIFLHGLGSTSSVWEPQTRALSNRFQAIRYDLEGAGRSPLTGPLSIESWVDDLGAIMAAQGIAKARFVGHSLGTLILQHFTVQNPERVVSLALIGVNRAPTEARRQTVRDRVAKVRAEGIESIADTVVKGGLSPHSYESKPEIVGFVRELLLRQDRDGYAACCEAMAASNAADISKVSCPTLVLSGQDDNVSPVAIGEAFAKELPNAQFQLLEQCGHWQPIEQPAAVNSALATFFSKTNH
jgi:pimeloyl-ACP methyl ester carboxylesterase